MVISTAYYGWGTKDTVGNVTLFLGMMISRTTCNDFFKDLTIDCVRSFQLLLASCHTGLMVWDNFQRGQELRNQCGGWSSKFLIVMVKATHRVFPFLNFRWDDCNIFMRYNLEQGWPSPLGMRAYETLDKSSTSFGKDVFDNHTSIHLPLSLCFTRDCVHQNECIINIQRYLCNMSRAFSHQYDCNGPGMNVGNVNKLNKYCTSSKLRKFFSSAYTCLLYVQCQEPRLPLATGIMHQHWFKTLNLMTYWKSSHSNTGLSLNTRILVFCFQFWKVILMWPSSTQWI